MKTAFVYSVEENSCVDGAEIAQSFHGTKMQYDTEHLVVFQAESNTDDLNEFHAQVVEYANANSAPDVYFHGLDIQIIRRVVFELLAIGAPAVFKLTETQRDFIWSHTA